jgi:hypothetical protein
MPDLGIGRHHIELQTGLLESGDQGDVERAARIAIETFGLAFGAGTIRAAAFDDEAAMPDMVEKAGLVTVLARPIDITRQDDVTCPGIFGPVET